jgi:hypothetical protein
MSSGVPQIVLGLVLIVGGILVVKALGNELGWILFVLGGAVAARGAMQLSGEGQKEIGN